MAKAARAFRNLTAPQMQAWRAYAAAQNRTDKLTGRTYAPAANSIFAGLAAKLLQIDPQAELPTAPPSSPFRSDSIRVTAQPAAGGITFIPSAPNSEGILTELILQPLKSIHRTPNPRSYRTMAFTSFAEGQPVTIPTRLTPYAPAYRFVDSATGQSSGLIPLPVITGID